MRALALLTALTVSIGASMAQTTAPSRPSAAGGEPAIQWDSKDVVESRMTRYKYTKIGPEYEKPAKGLPDPGTNFMVELSVSDEPPAVFDRLLKRDAAVTGRIVNAPASAKLGRIWLEDNYGRVLDEAKVAGPDFAFRLSAWRSVSQGLQFKAELTDGDKPVWSGAQTVRMGPDPSIDRWGDFLLGVYNMGTAPGTGELWRELGLNHRAVQTTNDPTFAAQNDLTFHASNIVYSLLGMYHRDYKRWWEIQAAEKAAKGPITLARHRCLSDPKEEKFLTDILTAAAMRFKPYRPLHYSIGDEIGIGDMASPHDLCGSKFCLARYRQWLKDAYGSVEQLNAQWETEYKSFDEAEMWSNWMALERAKTGNFSPWADRLAFMDTVLYGIIAKGAAAIRAVDPDAYCNISGVQQPSCWGFDHWLLSRTVNCATPYEIGEGPDVLMSFYDDGRKGKLHSPGFGNDVEGLWRAFIRGYHISQQWDSNPPAYSALIDIDKKQLTPFGKQVQEFANWAHHGPGRLRNLSQRQRDPVAILYSQPSLRGNWILEMTARPDVKDGGPLWITRGSWSVRQKERSFRVRVSWVQWMHDVSVWPKFVDASQVDEGYLTANGFKVLVLPRAVALSDRTAEAIRKFVAAGGTVIADTWCGLMDEHCRIRPQGKGVLDDLFAVKRGDYRKLDVTRLGPDDKGVAVDKLELPFVAFETTLRADGSQVGGVSNGIDACLKRQVGKGRAIYLNFDMESYFLHRMNPGKVAPARKFLTALLAEAGVKPVFAITAREKPDEPSPAGQDLCVYRNGRGYLVGVMQNPTVMHSEVGGIETRYTDVKDNVFTQPQWATLWAPKELHIYDLVRHELIARPGNNAFTWQADARKAHVFACWPFEITGVEAAVTVAEGKVKVSGKVVTSQPVEDEKLVVFMYMTRPDKTVQTAYLRTIDCVKGGFAAEIPVGLNEHGDWTLTVMEPCSGKVNEVRVRFP